MRKRHTCRFGGSLFVAPFVVGYGIAFGGYIPYGVVCKKKDDLFAGTIRSEDYMTFLMNRGCDFDNAARRAAEASQLAMNERILALLHDRRVEASADEILSAEAIRATMRTFELPTRHDDCPAETYCPRKRWYSDDVVSNLFAHVISSYASYAGPVLSDAIVSGATLLIAIGANGPVFSGLLFLAYASLVAVIGAVATKLFLAFVSRAPPR